MSSQVMLDTARMEFVFQIDLFILGVAARTCIADGVNAAAFLVIIILEVRKTFRKLMHICISYFSLLRIIHIIWYRS